MSLFTFWALQEDWGPLKGPSLVAAELALVEAAFESLTLMTAEYQAARALAAAAAELLTAEEAQDEVEEQPGTAAELVAMMNQVQAVQVCSAEDYLAPVV